jgi:hypothetical protein
MTKQLALKGVLTWRTVRGIEMGVLDDGTPFLTGRSLARLCGVAISTIIEQKDKWDAGDRSGKFARLLASTGFDEPRLATPVKIGGVGVGAEALAYPERVVMAALDYYGFELAKPEAIANYRLLGRAGFRLFVYGALGYDPANLVPGPWREFHDRLATHDLPVGYFSVFKEMSDFILLAIQNGFRLNHKNLPDISVGKAWSAHWQEKGLASRFGERIKHEHNFPDYFPQALSNPQEMWVYPLNALGEYKTWLQREYIPNQFPQYVAGKVKQGTLPASVAELLLTAVE